MSKYIDLDGTAELTEKVKAKVEGLLAQKADITSVPTNVSDLVNDSGFIDNTQITSTIDSGSTNQEVPGAQAVYQALEDKQDVTPDFIGTDGITDGESGFVPAPLTTDDGKFLKADGTWGTPQDTTYSAFTGTDGQTAGTSGLVPAPATTDSGKFLKADGTWATAGGGGSANISYGTTDLTPGVSPLNEGEVYLCYE